MYQYGVYQLNNLKCHLLVYSENPVDSLLFSFSKYLNPKKQSLFETFETCRIWKLLHHEMCAPLLHCNAEERKQYRETSFSRLSSVDKYRCRICAVDELRTSHNVYTSIYMGPVLFYLKPGLFISLPSNPFLCD